MLDRAIGGGIGDLFRARDTKVGRTVALKRMLQHLAEDRGFVESFVRPHGLDRPATPILADAIQDAGCDSDDVLNYCRQEGEHVRGCWVVDLVLGKE